jgi:hypothetical protein
MHFDSSSACYYALSLNRLQSAQAAAGKFCRQIWLGKIQIQPLRLLWP